MNEWIKFEFLLKNPYHHIAKGSVIAVDGEKFIVKRIDGIILLDDAVKEPNTVKVFARGIKCD